MFTVTYSLGRVCVFQYEEETYLFVEEPVALCVGLSSFHTILANAFSADEYTNTIQYQRRFDRVRSTM